MVLLYKTFCNYNQSMAQKCKSSKTENVLVVVKYHVFFLEKTLFCECSGTILILISLPIDNITEKLFCG